ncbi:type II secretion system GspH family protein [bacterium]|nr:type II secretion system GspH family protein [bacterium]
MKGFTLLELVVTIAIVGVVSGAIILAVNPAEAREKSRKAAAEKSLVNMAKAATIFAAEHFYYAPDTARGVAPEFVNYMSPPALDSGPFPGSSYDWDNWVGQTCWDGSTGGIQVSLRDINDYQDKTNYVLYYVISGQGIPHCNEEDARGECINCESTYP